MVARKSEGNKWTVTGRLFVELTWNGERRAKKGGLWDGASRIMAAELDFWHIMENGATMKEKVITKGSVVGLICSDTSNNAILLPEKHCGVDAKSGSGRWMKVPF